MGTRDDVYQQRILGLVHQITSICQKHDIPFAASFHVDDVSTETGDKLKVMRLSGCFSEAAFERVYFGREKLSVKVTLPERGRLPMDDIDETMSGSDALRLVIEKGWRVARRAWTDPVQEPRLNPGWSGWVSYLRASDFPGLTEQGGVTCSVPVGFTDYGRVEHKELALPSMYYVATGPVQSAGETRTASYMTFGWKPEMADIIATDWYVLDDEVAK